MTKVEQYIQDYTRGCSNELGSTQYNDGRKIISYHEWLTPDHARSVAQIAREETIEKACNYLFSHMGLFVTFFDDDIVEDIERSEFIKKFRKAMEDKL